MTHRNQHGQPVGHPLPDWTPRPAPEPVRLAGVYVRLEPAGPRRATELFAAVCAPDDDPLWTYRSAPMPATPEELARLLAADADSPSVVTFALIPGGAAEAATAEGLASLMRADPAHGSVEVGSILYSRRLQRTVAATEAMVLLARHVFEDLGYRRYEWKCDALNEPSRQAARRLGFTYEGRFRNAVVVKGRNRDTDWFSITDEEWRRLEPAYRQWLDPANFDEDGRQRSSLARLTAQSATQEMRT